MSDKELQKEILALENDVKQLEATINVIKKRITHLKDIAWDRQSQMEREQMLKVLNGEKESTEVQSNVGDVLIDSSLVEKLKDKHLDDPKLRGMVTSDEFLSFPKVAKGVEAEYDERYQGYSWKTKANDGSILDYGERDFGKGHRLLTAHSKTERGERGQLRQEFNDRDFHNSAHSAINSHDSTKTNTLTTQGSNATSIANESITQINAHNDEMETISSKLDSMHENLQKDLAELNNQPKAQHNEAMETDDNRDDNLRRM